MDIIFLGTSAGTPTKKRNVSAIALLASKGRSWYLIDCGEGTQHQLLRTKLSLENLSAIFITHLHGDHCFGLPGLLASAGLHGRTKPLKIVAPDGLEQWLSLTQSMSELYLPYALEFVQSNHQAMPFEHFTVSTVELLHRIPSVGYCFKESNPNVTLATDRVRSAGIPQGVLWGKLSKGDDIEHDGVTYRSSDYTDTSILRKVIICGDNESPELLKDACIDCDLLVHESTFAQAMAEQAKKNGHSYSTLIASFAEKARIPNLILTHISARYMDGGEQLLQEAKTVYSGNVFVANDFERYNLTSSSVIKRIEHFIKG